MKKGDILLTSRKLDPVGWVIRLFTHCPFHHTAWAISKTHLVEVVAKGKQIVPLAHYLNKWIFKCKLVRIKDINPNYLTQVVNEAMKEILHYSYISAILTFILVKLKLLKYLPRPTCSGWIAIHLSKINFYFQPNKNPEFITPKDIEKSPYVIDISEELL